MMWPAPASGPATLECELGWTTGTYDFYKVGMKPTEYKAMAQQLKTTCNNPNAELKDLAVTGASEAEKRKDAGN